MSSSRARFTGKETHAIVVALRSLTDERGNLGHGLDAYYTLDSEVSLVRQATCEVVRANLVSGNQRLRNQELGPLVQKVELARIVISYRVDFERRGNIHRA